jgi:tRNA 2-thiouridine synthesizing protein A
MPVLKAAREIRGLAPGQILKIVATDQGSLADVPAWAKDTGNEVIDAQSDGTRFVFFVKRGAA